MNNEAAGFDCAKKNVLICDTQPVAVEGMKWLIENSGDLRFAGSVLTLEAVYDLLNPGAARIAAELAAAQASETEAAETEKSLMAALEAEALGSAALEMGALVAEAIEAGALENESPRLDAAQLPVTEGPVIEGYIEEAFGSAVLAVWADSTDVSGAMPEAEPLEISDPIDAVVIDKGLGLPRVMELLQKLTSTSHPTPVVVWGAISEGEALRLLQAGARGILRRTSESGTLLTCLRAVTSGGTWMEDGIFGSTEKLFNPKRSQLTCREKEVVVWVEKGLRNRDIARMLGIQTGTVKIHLKHIFEKTGVRGRYGLAFTGLQSKGSIALTVPPQFTA